MAQYISTQHRFSGHTDEQAAFVRAAKAFNEIHRTLLDHPGAACTTDIGKRLAIFVCDNRAFFKEEFSEDDLKYGFNANEVRSLAEFEISAEEMNEVAEDMERWLANPQFITRKPEHRVVTPEIHELYPRTSPYSHYLLKDDSPSVCDQTFDQFRQTGRMMHVSELEPSIREGWAGGIEGLVIAYPNGPVLGYEPTNHAAYYDDYKETFYGPAAEIEQQYYEFLRKESC